MKKIADKDIKHNLSWFCAVNDFNYSWMIHMVPILIEAWENDDEETVDKIIKEAFTDGVGKGFNSETIYTTQMKTCKREKK